MAVMHNMNLLFILSIDAILGCRRKRQRNVRLGLLFTVRAGSISMNGDVVLNRIRGIYRGSIWGKN